MTIQMDEAPFFVPSVFPVCDEGGGAVSNGEEEEKDGRGRVD